MQAPFVDCHVHFWDPALLSYRWLAGLPSIAGKHTPADLHSEVGQRLPEQMVFVEADATSAEPFGELSWIEKLATEEPRIAGIVTQVDVDRGPESEALLEAARARPLVRGVRHRIECEADPNFCLRPDFVAGVRQVGERGLSFDLCIKHHQLPAVIELCRACPGTVFVLNHGGKPDVRGGQLDPWRANLRELARLPNVHCKLSGLVAEADPNTWTPAKLQPYADHMIACFGPDRLLFGSDWPVVRLGATYTRWLDVVLRFLARLDAASQAAILRDNARRVYRLA